MSDKKPQIKTVDEYISTFPENVRVLLGTLRDTIKTNAPEAIEVINYQIPTFQQYGNLVHFAAYKNHIGFYPGPTGIEAFTEELSVYEGAKGSVKFPIDQHLPLDLIAEIVRYRVKENQEKARSGSKRQAL